MKSIAYDFVHNGFYGQFAAERYWVNQTIVVSYNLATHTETRGDGPTRIFSYGSTAQPGFSVPQPYLKSGFTDFQGHWTYLSYDSHGYLNKMKDANGHITYFNRAPLTGNLLSLTHPVVDGAASSLIYGYTDQNTAYYLSSLKDELNHTTTYSPSGPNITSQTITYPDGGTDVSTFNGFQQTVTHKNVSGGTESFTYDTRGLLKTHTDASAHTTSYTYDINEHLSTVKDPRGNITTFYHNQRHQLTIIQYPDPGQTLVGFEYNDDGTLRALDEPLGQTTYAYDAYKRLTSVTRPQRFPGDATPRITRFYYHVTGVAAADYTHTDSNVTRTVRPSGALTVALYDDNFRPSSITVGDNTRTDSAPATTSYAYDAVGNRLSMKDPNGQTTGAQSRFTYDARNRLLTVDDPTGIDKNSLGHTVNYTYDQAGNKKSEQRANDQVVTYDTYDAMNRLTQMTVRQSPTPNAVTKYTWTKAGQVDTMTDPRLKVYNYDYDGMNRLIRTTYPADSGGVARTETRTYDAAGNVATFKNRAGNVQTFAYDARNRETRYDWNDGVTPYRTLTYDGASNILTCLQNSLITNTYYADGLLASQDIHNYNYGDYTGTITYTYDGDGRRATIQYPSGKKYSTTYTPRSEPRAVWDVTSGPATAFQAYYIYDRSGNLTTRNINQYQTHTNSTYDALNRLTQTQHLLAGSSPKFNYGFDEMSNRKYRQRNGGLGDGFGYDLSGQITGLQTDGTVNPATGTVTNPASSATLTYDANGNRVETTAPFNNLNQPTDSGTTYDANGNLKTDAGWSYTYDAMNRLTAVSSASASANFWYDGFNRICTWQVNGGGNARFNVWDGWNLIAEYKGGNVLDSEYLHGAGSDEMVSMTRAGQTYYFFQDGAGNTSHLASSSGALLESYRYGLYGKPTVYDPAGNVRSAGTAYGVRHLFGGLDYHRELQLIDYRNRFASIGTSKFMQPDPIGFAGDPANLYRYCGNNSVNKSDATGLGEPARQIPWYLEHSGLGGDPTVTYGGQEAQEYPSNYGVGPGGAGDPVQVSLGPSGSSGRSGSNGPSGPIFSSLASDPSVSFRSGNNPFGNGGRGGGGFHIGKHKLASFGKGFDGPGMRQFATVADRFALGASLVVAAPVVASFVVQAGVPTIAAARTAFAATREFAPVALSNARYVVAATYVGVVIPTASLTVNNPEAHEILEEVIENSYKWP